jgi:hypothetical protein
METVYDTMDDASLQKIKEIERMAYDGTRYAQMQDCDTWQDMAQYMECDEEGVHFLCTQDYYVLIAEHEDYAEIVDLACLPDKRCDLKKVAQFVETFDKPLTLDSRELTSYPIIKYMEKRGRVVITEDEVYDWNNEKFHSMKMITTKALERNPSMAEIEENDYER